MAPPQAVARAGRFDFIALNQPISHPRPFIIVTRATGSVGVANAYRLSHLDSYRHMGTIGREDHAAVFAALEEYQAGGLLSASWASRTKPARFPPARRQSKRVINDTLPPVVGKVSRVAKWRGPKKVDSHRLALELEMFHASAGSLRR